MDNEAAPYILSIGDESAKKKIYLQQFDVELLANLKGEKPIYKYGFLESQEAYLNRLKAWEDNEHNVIFDGWTCKDLGMFQVLVREHDSTKIEITPYSGYAVTTDTGKRIEFYCLPDTVDEFITDMKRLGIKLFWKDWVMNEYGDKITSDKKVVEYYRIIKEISKD